MPRPLVGRDAWNDVVHRSAEGWVWSTWEWQELIAPIERWQLEDVGFAVQDNNRTVGVVPLHWIASDRRLSGTGFGLTAPAVADDTGDRRRYFAFIYAHVRAIAAERQARRIEFALSPVARAALESSGANPFVEYGFADESGAVRVIDLRCDGNALLASFSKDARQQIRKAREQGFTARAVAWPEFLDAYYRLHEQTYRRTGVSPHPREYFAGIASSLYPAGYSLLTAVFAPDGTPVAFHNTARFGRGAMYHTGCSSEAALSTGANYLAFWHAIQHAKAAGCTSYEAGEVFPHETVGKRHGLSIFKSKFGGTTRPLWRGGVSSGDSDAAADDRTRQAYRRGELYSPSRICLEVDTGDDYADRLLKDKMAAVHRVYRGGRMVDLCCGTGAHALRFAASADSIIGIDFSERYVEAADRRAADLGITNARFICADARHIPLKSNCADILYCFSALYAIPNAADIVQEIGRILAPDGVAVLDYGNRRSLNALSASYYTEWPQTHPLTLREIREQLVRSGLEVVAWRRFQILPLWADRPRWLTPLLHPRWKDLLKRRVAGWMIDEWLSQAPLLRRFAFRHLIVCRKSS